MRHGRRPQPGAQKCALHAPDSCSASQHAQKLERGDPAPHPVPCPARCSPCAQTTGSSAAKLFTAADSCALTQGLGVAGQWMLPYLQTTLRLSGRVCSKLQLQLLAAPRPRAWGLRGNAYLHPTLRLSGRACSKLLTSRCAALTQPFATTCLEQHWDVSP